ncbi:GmrSD restriction endonuclease domain-containing protein [Candidatus Contendibacter odensensis]|uniref:GmrSD restriction endonucleases N-terminal domain-containing protein n=1 Tax=Candidatus Contendobacter odensis Run_B_J11 TaxID=1400861 RepID=A0A7U7J3X1_9GAMM|nr:DUF262 domain-containing protein [Candidatus Contendobacter odensis]CDH46641.1 conserved hypothetical protein [Candidatus Contendobacter odensis Run_B_J11]
MSTFDSTKRLLPEILADIVKGKIQLPDFQRGWVWDDDHVRSLLISVARSFPVGAVMLLEAGGEANFQVRPVENVSFDDLPPKADMLILDGQQRLTTLTQVLALKGAVKTYNDKGKHIERYYYFHIPTALESTERLEDALLTLEPDRKQKTNFGRDVKLDLSTAEAEYANLYFPCSQIFNWSDWLQGLNKHNPSKLPVFLDFQRMVLNAFNSYQLPIIALKKETSKEAVCLVFEKVNTGGVALSVFELMTATYAADGYNLRDDWFGSSLRHVESRQKRLSHEPLLNSVETTDFLQAIAMLHTLDRRREDIKDGKTGKQVTPVSAKRATILLLPLVAYQKWADRVEVGFLLAAKFLRKECLINLRDLPYRTQLAPLASVLGLLGDRWLEPRIHDKLAQWYWCGVLGELYGGAVETRIANDVEELLGWIERDAEPPRTITDAAFQPDRLDRLTSRLSAAYKGLNVLVLREGAKDFFWKANIRELDAEDVALDIHHIFPQDWCEKNGSIPRKLYNTVVNKTPISYKANRMIGGSAPSQYLQKIQKHSQVQIGDADMNTILGSHCIPADHLRSDDFAAFYQARKQNLLILIEKAIGKQAIAVAMPEEDDTEMEEMEG